MTGDRVVVIAVTRAGSALAAHIAAALPGADVYAPARFLQEINQEINGTATPYTGPVSALTASLFPSASGLIFVLAAGAVVRLIAPMLRDKRSDPAVVAVDDAGRFAIALLGGHGAGANDLATRVSTSIGATPVITTASEAHALPAADLIGREYGWRIERESELKAVAAALVNGDPVGVFQDAGERAWHGDDLPETVTPYPDLESMLAAAPAAAIVISDRALVDGVARPGWVWYRPQTLVLGIGCSRGASAAEIGALIQATLSAYGLSGLSVAEVATIDVKAGEPGLLAFAQGMRLPLRFYSAAELDGVAGQEHPSAVVLKAVGTRGVCEPAALLAAGASRLLVPKQKSRAVTVAVARRAFTSDER